MLLLPLPGGDRLAERVELARQDEDGLHWLGRLVDAPEFQLSLSAHRGHLAGLIYTPDQVYELAIAAGGRSELWALAQERFPDCEGGIPVAEHDHPRPVFSPIRGHPSPSGGPQRAGPDPADQIDLLVIYRPEVLAHFGSHAAAQAHGQAAVDVSNLAFVNSQMVARYRVAANLFWNRSEATYPDGSLSPVLAMIRDDPWVIEMRDRWRADMVGLMVQDGRGACGVGYVMRNPGPNFARSAMQVTARSCAVGGLTWAHEHGHNFGFEHNPENSSATAMTASFPWSFGHYVPHEPGVIAGFRTVMSYSSPCGGSNNCPRQAFFSNPLIAFQGRPTGIAGERDNAHAGNSVAEIVANFRLARADLIFAQGFEAP